METPCPTTAKRQTSASAANPARGRKRRSRSAWPYDTMSLPQISALGRGNLRAQLVRILDRLYPWPGMPALGNFQNAIAGFEHTARHIAGFLAGQPNDDRRNPA